jgi:hypothetical protein
MFIKWVAIERYLCRLLKFKKKIASVFPISSKKNQIYFLNIFKNLVETIFSQYNDRIAISIVIFAVK